MSCSQSRALYPLALATALLLGWPAAAPGQASPPQAAAADTAAATAQAELQPGDLIRLKIWREPDLSGDYLVDEAGVAIFPLLGPMQVTAAPADSLKVRLTAAYQEYLRHPSIEVLPLRRVNILGSVRNPGLHPVDATMTLADALALAGGTTPQGDVDKIELIRTGERIHGRLSQRTMIADLAIRSGDQLFVPERSWISRNATVVATTISASVSLVIALFIRR
jgi:polysaccharide export outer membrane protein